MSFRDRLKGIGGRVALAFALENEDAVKEFVRSYMVARVEPYTAGQLAYAIANNSDLWSNIPSRYKLFGQQVANNPKVKEMYQKYSAEVNANTVMEWLKADRPDLYGVILNWGGPEAMAWLSSQTEKVKAGLLQGETIAPALVLPAPQDGAPSQPRTSQAPPSAKEVSQPVFRRFEAGSP